MGERRGILFLVVGPSGVGKDSLIDGARRRLGDGGAFHFPRRVITRPEEAGGEDHRGVTAVDFERLDAAGDFMLGWEAHGHRYGVPRIAERALAEGRSVIVNVSRQVIGQARHRWPPVRVLLVTAPSDVLRARLTARGREEADDIRRRLERMDSYRVDGEDVREIVNADRLEQAIDRFVAVIDDEVSRVAIGGRGESAPSA